MRTEIIAPEHLGIGQNLMLAAGLLAGSGFTLVSIAANMRFGVSLASTPFDRIVYATLSIAADLMKIALPLVVAILWRKGERIFAFAGAVFWIGAVAFSICAAIGFAASTRSHTVAVGESLIESRKAWEAKITRIEGRLDLLSVHRPANVIQAEIDSLLLTAGADDCKAINGPITQEVCPKVDRLRQELAASQEVARLEADLAADRGALSEMPVAALLADPQSAALSRLTGVGEEELRNVVAVLIAFLVELGSALGFSVIILAARSTVATSQALSVEENKEPSPPSRETTQGRHPSLSETPDDLVTRWALARLDIVTTGTIQADVAYQDFREWCSAHRLAALTPQMFGRRFTKVHAGMGGRKVKRCGRAYYEGTALQEKLTSPVRVAEPVRRSHSLTSVFPPASAGPSRSGGQVPRR
jgi:hypothetical protein